MEHSYIEFRALNDDTEVIPLLHGSVYHVFSFGRYCVQVASIHGLGKISDAEAIRAGRMPNSFRDCGGG